MSELLDCETRDKCCYECGRRLLKLSALKIHRRTHTGEKPFKCDSCDVSFNCSSNLLRHFRLVHENRTEANCNECLCELKGPKELKQHMMLHTGERPFKCGDCGKSFVQKIEHTIHMRWHAGEKPYGCTECSKKFVTNSKAKEHFMRIHAGRPMGTRVLGGLKKRECAECFTLFSQTRDLEIHMRRHTGQRFRCEDCGKTFRDPSSHLNHSSTHSVERLWECSGCTKTYKHQPSLYKHMRKAHPIQ